MKKVAFIAFSDIQIEDWKQHNENHVRLYHNQTILKSIHRACLKYKCPALFCGDIYDNPKFLSNLVLNKSLAWFKVWDKNTPMFAIPGNHDQSEKNSLSHTSPNYISMLELITEGIKNISFRVIKHGHYNIYGIPYLNSHNDMEEAIEKARKEMDKAKGKKILLIHSDLPGAIDTSGREVGSSNLTWRLSRLFRGFDLVLSGHIHKPQIIRRKKPTILMLGATHQQRVTDSGNEMGYWIIYHDLTFKFVPLTKIPGFIYIKPGETKPDDLNFYIQEKKPIIREASSINANFRTTNPIKLANSYMKVKEIKSKSKRNILIKYLS